ncbi:MAG: Cro/CI family transcriptional regulator [Janthinobacterium svalbardensis]
MDTKTIIKKLGGGVKVAALCQVSPAAVSQWSRNGIPNARLMFLRLARPEVFSADEEADPHSGHPGRQPPSSSNIFDTVPEHCVVGVDPRTRV